MEDLWNPLLKNQAPEDCDNFMLVMHGLTATWLLHELLFAITTQCTQREPNSQLHHILTQLTAIIPTHEAFEVVYKCK